MKSKPKVRTPFIIMLAAMLLVGAVVQAADRSQSSGMIYTSQAVVATPALICGITIHTNGVSPAAVNLHDGSSTSGVSRWSIKVPAANLYATKSFVPPMRFNNGIYFSAAVVSGVSETATAVIEYIEER